MKDTLGNTVRVEVRRWLQSEVWVDLDSIHGELTEEAVLLDASAWADSLLPAQWEITDEEGYLPRAAKDLIAKVKAER